MVVGTLFGSKDNFRVQKVLVAAKYSGKDLDLQDNFDPNEFIKKFPIGNQTGLEIQGSDGKKKHLCLPFLRPFQRLPPRSVLVQSISKTAFL